MQENKKTIKKERKYQLFGLKEERRDFLVNLSMLLGSGMDLIAVLETIKEETKAPKMVSLINEVQIDIESGQPLWRSMKSVGLWPDHLIALIRLGEESGRLAENLEIIALEQEKSEVFRSHIRSAMLYPVIVLSLTLLIGIGVAWFLLPKLADIFSDLKVELPLITKILIQIGQYLSENGYYVVPLGLGVVGLAIYLCFFYPKTKVIGESLFLALPATRNLIVELEISRFGFVLGTLLKAGIPISHALASLGDSANFHAYRKIYQTLKQSIDEGSSFKRTFKENRFSKFIPLPIQQMIASAEQSGNLPGTLLKIESIYREKTETSTKNLAIILEPVLLVIVWIGVVILALAVIMPIYGMLSGIENQ